VPELKEYLLQWHRIDEKVKGHALGVVLGRYGVDLFAYAGVHRLTQLCRELKKALAHFILENAFQDSSLRDNSLQEEILTQSQKHREAREDFLQSHKVNWEKQLPWIPELTQAKNSSLWEEKGYLTLSKETLEKLLKNKAGSGQPVHRRLGDRGYVERVYFGQKIGVWIENKSPKTGKKPLRQRTAFGILHYNEKGEYYLLPAPPSPL
jgi:hypothetical protein